MSVSPRVLSGKTAEVCRWLLVAVLVAGSLSASAGTGTQTQTKQAVDYVDPNIGGIGVLLTPTIPFVQRPHGMMRVAPATPEKVSDRYLADRINGFAIGPITVSPVSPSGGTGTLSLDHDREKATPYFYSLHSDKEGIHSEAATTEKAALFRFTSQKVQRVQILLPVDGSLKLVDQASVMGQSSFGPHPGERVTPDQVATQYFYIHSSQPVANLSCSEPASGGQECTLDLKQPVPSVEVEIGISYIDADQAHKNLSREVGARSFAQIVQESRDVWNTALRKISVEGGTERQKRIFYTSLYRSLLRMMDITEDDRYYSGFDRQVHQAEGRHFYTDDGLWDTYRSLHPLQLLIEPREQQDAIRSYLRMYQQSGWLPSFPSVSGERAVMIGHHATAFITDAYLKGYRDFDVQLAFEAMKKNAMEATMLPWRRGPATPLDTIYREKGFFPALQQGEKEDVEQVHPFERRQASSVTLEESYDDWALSQFAEAIGRKDDAALFLARAHNYENIFDPKIGFIAAKDKNGDWIRDFDPKLGGGQGGRAYFAEVDSWVDTFHVQHDPEGLIRLMGGREKFVARLDALFQEPYGTSKWSFMDQFPDMTGLIGLYPQGNEPAFHIPYLYVFAGEPWKTQKHVRQIMELEFDDRPQGVPGDEDGGAMSSWYVFSAMGFYPVCPGSPAYEIGSPIFSRSVISLGNGKTFTIVANHVSAANKYIQSASLNGKKLDKAWFEHASIAGGGTLVLEMGPTPNTTWGAAPELAPLSMSRPATVEVARQKDSKEPEKSAAQ